MYNPSTEIMEVNCSIYDWIYTQGGWAHNDRFYKFIVLKPGWNSVEISISDIEKAPAKRHLDIRDIQGLHIYTKRLPRPRVAYLDDIRLRK
jgi:hypothetical protein